VIPGPFPEFLHRPVSGRLGHEWGTAPGRSPRPFPGPGGWKRLRPRPRFTLLGPRILRGSGREPCADARYVAFFWHSPPPRSSRSRAVSPCRCRHRRRRGDQRLLQVTERSAAAHRPCERQLSPERDRKSRGARPGRKGGLRGTRARRATRAFRPFPDRNLAPGKTIRGTFAIEFTATGGGQGGTSAMSYGFIAAAPTPHLLNPVLRRRRIVPEPIKTRRPRLAIFART
jgi:hypothetical protein